MNEIDAVADANSGSVSSEPGVYAMGTRLGAAVGGIATGALMGSVAGPVGAVVGAVVGAAAGGLAGNAASEAFNPSAHDGYCSNARQREPYLSIGDVDEHYVPGYRSDYEVVGRHTSQKSMFSEVEPEKRARYERHPLGRKYGTAL